MQASEEITSSVVGRKRQHSEDVVTPTHADTFERKRDVKAVEKQLALKKDEIIKVKTESAVLAAFKP